VRLRDYFTFPESFAFIEVPGADAVKSLGHEPRTVIFEFALSEPLPKGLLLDTTSVRLHCVPVVNVFRHPMSLPLTADKTRCSLRFGDDVPEAELFSIDRVSLVNRALRGESIEPWARFFPPDLRAVSHAALLYQVHHVPAVFGHRLDVALSFGDSDTARAALADKLSADVDVLATNGPRAGRVGLGEVCVPTTTSPSQISFRNVTPVTRPCSPALGGDRLWRFFAFLKANLATVTDVEYLETLLGLANLPAIEHWPEAKPDAERFIPLLRVERRRERWTRLHDVRLGAAVRVDVDAARFAGMGDLDLFGELLVPLFASTIHEHEWVELTLADAGGRPLFQYPRQSGTRRGL
jgi:type VI secretion system protein ImpG